MQEAVVRMVLNDEQNELFFDVMDSLLYYVNDRFRVVEGFTLDYASPLDDVKGSLVARALWENVGIIDDFVRENPYHLSGRGLNIARSWKNALPGVYALVRYQSGRALMMSEAGVFSVCGVTYELESEIGPAPAYVETVLLPFEDEVIYDGFLQAYDTNDMASDAQRIQDEFENRCAKGIAASGAEFTRQAGEYLAAQRDKELDALLAEMAREAEHGEEKLPDGFHRGVLAGLPPEERRRVREEYSAGIVIQPAITAREFDRRVHKREPVTSLKACLSLQTKAQLERLAQLLGMGGLSRLRKAEIVDEIASELPNYPMALEARLTVADDEEYAFLRKMAREGVLSFGLGERAAYADAWPAEPYVLFFRGRKGYTAVVPDELRSLLANADFDGIDRMRRQRKQAVRCAAACVVMCGVAAMDDVYDQYRALVADPIEREEFAQLLEIETMLGYQDFDLWTYEPHDYLVHYTLTPDFIAEEMAYAQSGEFGELMRHADTGELSMAPFERLFDQMRADLASELEALEAFKRDLVESQSNLPMRPLSRTLLENDVIGELLDNENVVRLKAYLDAHVPDGENDYTFADRVAEDVVLSCIESGSLPQMFSYVVNLGLGVLSEESEKLPMLLTNVFNSMPSWENNGWSPQELYEQVTGRKMFYNDDGTVMKVGADDPCPCGSGKKYRDCCGR